MLRDEMRDVPPRPHRVLSASFPRGHYSRVPPPLSRPAWPAARGTFSRLPPFSRVVVMNVARLE
jgi:hypothetical protein